MIKKYLGHPHQTRGVEQYVMQGGKGDGMHFLEIRNGLGLEVQISLDRCSDISRLTFKGMNAGYMTACGYVAPAYYDRTGDGFLRSFNAGFFTTCGLTNAGVGGFDNGVEVPMHGTIGNVPSVLVCAEENDDGIVIKTETREGVLFGDKFVLRRKYFFPYNENIIELTDEIENESDRKAPFVILYHCNMGYPLLCEDSEVVIPANSVKSRTENAKEYESTRLVMEEPQPCFAERCYFYDLKDKDGIASAGIYNKKINMGAVISVEKEGLPDFTEWKMMGIHDYVLGLEPSNSPLYGQIKLEESGLLPYLQPGEKSTKKIVFRLTDDKAEFDRILSF